jgi:hypothetical protein
MSDWIDELSNDAQLVEAQTTARAAKALAADKAIRAEMPEYLRSLEIEFREVGRKLSEKPHLHTSLFVTDDSDPEVERRIRVVVTFDTGGFQESTHTNLYHGIGEKFIRCHPLEETPFNLRFAVRGSDCTVGVYADNSKPTLMTAAQAARYIIEPMIKRVRR